MKFGKLVQKTSCIVLTNRYLSIASSRGMLMNRRDSLRAGGLSLMAMAATAGKISAAVIPKKVIVIGAGVSGLAAAKTLVSRGHSVIVLEGRNRIGGRIATSAKWADAPVDHGASWIHGQTGNPITAIAKQVGAPLVTTNENSMIVYNTDGKVLDATSSKKLESLRSTIARSVTKAQNSLRSDIPLQSAIEAGTGWASRPLQDQIWMRYLINSDYEQEYGGSATSLSALWFDQDSDFSGRDLLFTKGYRSVTDFLAQGLSIQLNQIVTRVRIQGAQVIVDTKTGSFTADKVVVTLPLGVLKSGAIQFSPALPQAKVNAINSLRMGILNKCFLRFNSVFWAQNYDWIGTIPTLNGRWAEWCSLSRQTGKPIIVGFNAADYGAQLEFSNDATIVQEAMATLRKVYGNSIPNPVDYQITRWATDSFSSGSYSYIPVGAKGSMMDDLAANVSQTIYFAGEATNRKYPATVHGAYLSGVRAGTELV